MPNRGLHRETSVAYFYVNFCILNGRQLFQFVLRFVSPEPTAQAHCHVHPLLQESMDTRRIQDENVGFGTETTGRRSVPGARLASGARQAQGRCAERRCAGPGPFGGPGTPCLWRRYVPRTRPLLQLAMGGTERESVAESDPLSAAPAQRPRPPVTSLRLLAPRGEGAWGERPAASSPGDSAAKVSAGTQNVLPCCGRRTASAGSQVLARAAASASVSSQTQSEKSEGKAVSPTILIREAFCASVNVI